METIIQSFYKNKSYRYFFALKCTSIGIHKKRAYRLSTHLYDQVYI